jgi:hypothetical protein
MYIKAREVVVKVVDEINLTADQWDSRRFKGDNVCRRDHLAKIFNLRVKKLAPKCDAAEFYRQLTRFSREMSFGEPNTIAHVTERVYNVKLDFSEEQAAA